MSAGFLHLARQVVPGEQLPRLALSICWRTDGEPCGTTRASSRTSASRALCTG